EEKTLSLFGTTASDGICGGIDLHGGVGLHQPEPEPGPSCSPNSPPMPQPPSSIVQATATTPQRFENACGCRQDLVQLEQEKRDVLKDIRQSLKEANEMNNNFQRQIIELKKAKLTLEERRLLLEEMRFARPSISAPIILPDES
ncbi:myb-related transcription factor, partner of profilin-like, partial [Clarias magur]